MSQNHVKVQISLDALGSELKLSLQKVICLVGHSLNAQVHSSPSELALPTTIKSSFSNIDWDKDTFQHLYTGWVLSNGLRDAIESTNQFLDSAHRILSIWEFIEKKQPSKTKSILGKDWHEFVTYPGKKFHRFGLPDKVDHISIDHRVELPPSVIEKVLSINAARNCYVHRSGIVSERDINSDDKLIVKWSCFDFYVETIHGKQELATGQTIEKDSVVCAEIVEREKTFPIGQQLVFSVEEISEILWCLCFFGDEIVKIMDTIGRDRGYFS